jgi:ribosome-binding ATPase YchF (GTP1/OBG family)
VKNPSVIPSRPFALLRVTGVVKGDRGGQGLGDFSRIREFSRVTGVLKGSKGD